MPYWHACPLQYPPSLCLCLAGNSSGYHVLGGSCFGPLGHQGSRRLAGRTKCWTSHNLPPLSATPSRTHQEIPTKQDRRVLDQQLCRFLSSEEQQSRTPPSWGCFFTLPGSNVDYSRAGMHKVLPQHHLGHGVCQRALYLSVRRCSIETAPAQ